MSSPVRSESVSESEIDTDVDLDQVLTKYLPKHNRKQLVRNLFYKNKRATYGQND